MDSFEFVMFIVLWERILRAFNSSSKEVQSPKMGLWAACRLLIFTKNELQHIRESWDVVVETASAIFRSRNIKVSFSSPYGVRTRNVNEYDTAFEDHSHSLKVNVFYRTLDIALHELNTHFKGHQSVMQLLSFLYPQFSATCSNDEIRSATMNNMQKYGNDFSEDLEFEIRSFATEFKSDIIQKHEIKDIVKILQDSRVISSFPQFHKLLILFLTISVTVAAAERSFSKLKLIKTYLRSSMAQSRLSNLAIISIENEEAKAIDRDDLIFKFASLNARRERRFQT